MRAVLIAALWCLLKVFSVGAFLVLAIVMSALLKVSYKPDDQIIFLLASFAFTALAVANVFHLVWWFQSLLEARKDKK